jgi:hypothetical protein
MNVLVKEFPEINQLNEFISSASTQGATGDEVLDYLDKMKIDWYVSEEGSLVLRYWQIGADTFVPPEKAAIIRSTKSSSEQVDNLDWLNKNLDKIRESHSGKWIAIHKNAIVASGPNMPGVLSQLGQLAGIDKPLITYIPEEPILWTFAYANKRF